MKRRALKRRYGHSNGYAITYSKPRSSTRRLYVNTREELAKEKAWLDAGGYSYRVSAVR
jgi:hypothetical protein